MIKKLRAIDLLLSLQVKREMEVEPLDSGLIAETVRASLIEEEEGKFGVSLAHLLQAHPHLLLQVAQDHLLQTLDLLIAEGTGETRSEEI